MPRSDVQSPGEKRIIEGLAIVLFDKIADLARSTTLPKLLLFQPLKFGQEVPRSVSTSAIRFPLIWANLSARSRAVKVFPDPARPYIPNLRAACCRFCAALNGSAITSILLVLKRVEERISIHKCLPENFPEDPEVYSGHYSDNQAYKQDHRLMTQG